MSVAMVLSKARELFLAGGYRMKLNDQATLFLWPELLHDAAGGDEELKNEVLLELDKASPGSVFGFFVVGGVMDARGEVEHTYCRNPREIAAVIAKATTRAVTAES